MYIRIRNVQAKNGEGDVMLIVSKKTEVKQLREMIYEKLKIEPIKQKLFYKGKLLVDDHCIFDYNVQLNDVLQLIVNENPLSEKKEVSIVKNEAVATKIKLVPTDSIYYKIGDKIDFRDISKQWLEAEILEILKNNSTTSSSDEKSLMFKIKLDGTENCEPFEVEFDDIRPRSYHSFTASNLTERTIVMINYNIDDPKSLGYWYDFEIGTVNRKYLKGTLFLDKLKTPLSNITINLKESTKIWRIEPVMLVKDRLTENITYPKLRELPYNCDKCKDNVSVKCKHCGCKICFLKNDWENLLICDECNLEYHIYCLKPPLEKVPDDPEWYCPSCKIDSSEIVKPGENLKKTKSKNNGNSTRDWGRGMACVGNTNKCTIVPKNHVGSIPGVEVGTCWKFRNQVSEAGIHRPLVAGIHGRENECAYSIVLSGGYEDDVDNGEEFYYTGSGGRDLSGNKRENAQSSDQKLTALNKALALNCNAKFDAKNGAEAKDWKKGKPVRVVRNYKLRKHSKYAPKEGNRYDGIYKVVKYFPEKGLSGFIVWKYFLRRDDPTPSPWDKDEESTVLYPDGYLEAEAEKKRVKAEESKSKQNQKRKRKSPDRATQSIFDFVNSPKRSKMSAFNLDEDTKTYISNDDKNEKIWNECKENLVLGKSEFLLKVQDAFMCICCQEVVYLPVTTECKHNVCKECLKRSFTAGIYNCPMCRNELGQKYKMQINDNLQKALMALFPGYETSR